MHTGRATMSEEEEKYVMHGSPQHKPIPEESLGIQIYNTLSSMDPSKEIIIDAISGKTILVQELLEKTCKLAQALSNCGYNTHDVIGISSENNTGYFPLVFAAWYRGICLAPMNPNYTKSELQYVLNITKPKLIFCSGNSLPKIVALKETTESYIERIVVFDLMKERALPPGVEDFEAFTAENCNSPCNLDQFRPMDVVDTREHLALILCSSGTTGLPKGVMLTHRNLSWHVMQSTNRTYYVKYPNGTFLAFLPFFHVFGLLCALGNILDGNRVVVLDKFQEEAFLETVQNYKASILWIVPPILVFLTKSPLVQRYDLSSVKVIASGAAPLGKHVQEAMGKIFNLDRMVQGYGLTEAPMAVLLMPVTHQKYGSCGHVVPAAAAKIRDLKTGENLPAGKVGELCFKGDMVMKGYFGNEEATKSSFCDGWLLTGDMAYYDEEGFFYIVDRLKELIKYKGYQVAPAELEAVLLSNPKIKDAAVIGIPDEEAGELPCAFVVKETNVDLLEDEVKEMINSQLSSQKTLRGGVRFVDEIPKSPSGKILRRILREAAARKS